METKKILRQHKIAWIGVCVLALSLIYVFQRIDYLGVILSIVSPKTQASSSITFIVDKALRLVLNDLICVFLIFILFGERKYLRVALVIFCFEFFIILPLYLVLKLKLEGTSEISSPLLSQIHRLIVNPMLMIFLIISFYYQDYTSPKFK